MTDNPTQPDGEASPQDQDLEAQLDDMLNQLGDASPEPVLPEPVEYKPEEASEPEPVSEPAPVQPDTPEPVASTEATAEMASEPTEQPASSLDPDNLSAMTNDLLSAQIDSTIEAAEAEARIEAFAEDEPLHDPVQPLPTEDAVGDSLDEQIQGLLNEAREQESVEHQASAEGETTPIEGGTEAVTPEIEAQAVTPEPVEAPEPQEVVQTTEPTEMLAEATEESNTETEPADTTGAVSIDQIDEMLAESAEMAIEHGPTPEADVPPGTDEVLAAQAKAEEEAEARAKAARDAAEPMPVAVTPEPEPVEPAPAEPEPVASEPVPAATGGASAQDVANELDEDSASAVTQDEEPAEAAFTEAVQSGQPDNGFDTEPVVVNRSGLQKAEHALLIICSKVNKPLNGLSQEMRDSVGYAGVVTTGLAFFMLLYGVLF